MAQEGRRRGRGRQQRVPGGGVDAVGVVVDLQPQPGRPGRAGAGWGRRKGGVRHAGDVRMAPGTAAATVRHSP